jgi:hypothetical protein
MNYKLNLISVAGDALLPFEGSIIVHYYLAALVEIIY